MKQVFILGNPRSGTSLLRLMLQQHSSIVAPPECGFAHWLFPMYKDWSLKDAESEEMILQFVQDTLASKKMETWQLDRDVLVSMIKKQRPSSYEALTVLVYLTYKNQSAVNVIVDKNNYYLHHLADLKNIWPNATYIHMVRDGRDVACSYLEVQKVRSTSPYKPYLTTSIEEIAMEWAQNNTNIVAFASKQEEPYHTLRFEDLVADTTTELIRLCKFLGVPFEATMLTYYKDRGPAYAEPNETSDWKEKLTETIDDTRVGRYKGDLSTSQLTTFRLHAKDMLSHFNYD